MRHRIAWLFTDDPEVVAVFADTVRRLPLQQRQTISRRLKRCSVQIPLICSFQLADEISGIAYGILRGSGLAVRLCSGYTPVW